MSPKCFIFVILIFYCPSSFLMVRTRFFSVLAAWKYIVWWLIYFLTIASVVTTLVTLVSAHNHLNTPLVFSIVVSCLIYTTYSIKLDIHYIFSPKWNRNIFIFNRPYHELADWTQSQEHINHSAKSCQKS